MPDCAAGGRPIVGKVCYIDDPRTGTKDVVPMCDAHVRAMVAGEIAVEAFNGVDAAHEAAERLMAIPCPDDVRLPALPAVVAEPRPRSLSTDPVPPLDAYIAASAARLAES